MNFRLTRTYKSRPECEEVVCKYEHVREPRFATAISFCSLHFAFCILHLAFCILHFASCILQNLPVAKTDFSKRIYKVDVQLCYVGLQIELRVHVQH